MTAIAHEIPGGACWSISVPADRLITLTALGAATNVSMQLFAADRLDRLNVPDTMKAQMSACIKPPMVLMSDRGTGLASVVASTLGWHDCLGGLGSDAHLVGGTSYASHRNDWKRSARTLMLLEFAKYGLGESDLHASVNWFSKVAISDPDAGLSLTPGHCSAGDAVTLRTEQPVLVMLSTCPHPLSPDGATDGVAVAISEAEPVSADDPSRTWRAESGRALDVTEMVVLR
ncbi:urea carboxylase [Nocardioides baekrokdamisoli]|uniref:Urea carboxylase n=1 Tax=Nocardioides baekrokdamisoli TaxID=1804624 RepID=A0A3G9ICR5_9ACTN|nr:DUF1989 domain-containing protein [Nocardioides baekrokdamisoli]BBH16737.1 urea carboxylase [Nocardioides baekrokdamisoli]